MQRYMFKNGVIYVFTMLLLGCGDVDQRLDVADQELLEQSARMRARSLRYEVYVDTGSKEPELIGAGILQINGYKCAQINRALRSDFVVCRSHVNVSVAGVSGSDWQIGVDWPKPTAKHFFDQGTLDYTRSLTAFSFWASKERRGRARHIDIGCFIHGDLPGEDEALEEQRCLGKGRALSRAGKVWVSLYGEDVPRAEERERAQAR